MKFAASTLKRAGAVAALSAALLSATGCGYIYTQPTTLVYSASDGVKADVSDVKLRNIMVIATDANSEGRVLGTILNDGNEDVTVEFAFESGTQTVQVPAGEEVRLEDDAHKLIVSPAGAEPGHNLDGTQVTVNGESTEMNIPVLDGTLDEYASYLPNAASSDAASETATEEATQ